VRRRTSGNVQERKKMKDMQGSTAYVTDAKNRTQVKEENKRTVKVQGKLKKQYLTNCLNSGSEGWKITTKMKAIMEIQKLLKK
jgi:hypothetical protein